MIDVFILSFDTKRKYTRLSLIARQPKIFPSSRRRSGRPIHGTRAIRAGLNDPKVREVEELEEAVKNASGP